MKPVMIAAMLAAAALGACAKTVANGAAVAPAATAAPESPSAPTEPASAPVASIPPVPTEHYVCGGTKLSVKLLGAAAEVSVDGEAPVSLPVLGDAGDTYTNGRLTVFIKQSQVGFARGRMATQACVAAS